MRGHRCCDAERARCVALIAGLTLFGLVSSGAASVSVNAPCSGGGAALVAAIASVNASGGGSVNLDSGCTYSLTVANNPVSGGNGLPVITSPLTVNGKGATIAGNSSNFRIFMVDGNSGGALTLNGVTITGGKVLGMMAGGLEAGSSTSRAR